jgi:hypothetical protein
MIINKKSKPGWLKPSKNLINDFKYNSPFKIGKLKDNPKVSISMFKTNRPAQLSISKKQMNWEQARAKYHLSPSGDADKDGVINMFDCRPYNKARQGPQHEMMVSRKITEKEFKQNKSLAKKQKESKVSLLSKRRKEIMETLKEKPYLYRGRGLSKKAMQQYRPKDLPEALRTTPYSMNQLSQDRYGRYSSYAKNVRGSNEFGLSEGISVHDPSTSEAHQELPSSRFKIQKRNKNIDIVHKELELQGVPHYYKPKREKIISERIPIRIKPKRLKQEPKEIDEAYITPDNVKDVVEDVTISEKIEQKDREKEERNKSAQDILDEL